MELRMVGQMPNLVLDASQVPHVRNLESYLTTYGMLWNFS